jgi:3',5'-cyclic AMP phosphodiesterase CpdA
MKPNSINRREFLTVAGLAALGGAAACSGQASPTYQPVVKATPSGPRKRLLRLAHLTDFHVEPDGPGAEGMARALRHAQSQPDRPDFILNTGDCVMDSLGESKNSTNEQWDTFNRVLKAELKLPIFHAIGNHDVWGWGWNSPDIKADPLYGKAMALQQLGLKQRYYSFDRGGWHFIVLDSTHKPNEASKYPYIGKLDDEQFDWLVKDVEATPASTPVCLASHIPIVSACEYFDGENEESGNWVIPAAWVHIDARRLRQFFLQHPNLRLCLSGHTHQHERVDYLNVTYFTNGAVCGSWWKGAYLDFPPAYVLVDLYDDGSAESQFVSYDSA